MADTQSAPSIAYTRAPFSTWLGIVCLFGLFGLIVLAVIGPSPRTSDYEETRAKKRMEKLKTLHEESQKELTTYAWVDKNKGVARIPIDRKDCSRERAGRGAGSSTSITTRTIDSTAPSTGSTRLLQPSAR